MRDLCARGCRLAPWSSLPLPGLGLGRGDGPPPSSRDPPDAPARGEQQHQGGVRVWQGRRSLTWLGPGAGSTGILRSGVPGRREERPPQLGPGASSRSERAIGGAAASPPAASGPGQSVPPRVPAVPGSLRAAVPPARARREGSRRSARGASGEAANSAAPALRPAPGLGPAPR